MGIAVQNLDDATVIYSDRLDMRVVESRHDVQEKMGKSFRLLNPLKGAQVELFELNGSMFNEAADQNQEGMKHLTLSVPDLDICYRELIARKVEGRLEDGRIVIGSPFLGEARLEIVSQQGV